jgi:hypothetical protein
MRRVALRKRGLSRADYLALKQMFRRAVMIRAGAQVEFDGRHEHWSGACVKCLRTRYLQVSHIESVGSAPALEFDFDNVLAMCLRCHLYWWHRGGHGPEEWLRARIGNVARDLLIFRAKTARRPDLAAILVAVRMDVRARVHPDMWAEFEARDLESRRARS